MSSWWPFSMLSTTSQFFPSIYAAFLGHFSLSPAFPQLFPSFFRPFPELFPGLSPILPPFQHFPRLFPLFPGDFQPFAIQSAKASWWSSPRWISWRRSAMKPGPWKMARSPCSHLERWRTGATEDEFGMICGSFGMILGWFGMILGWFGDDFGMICG